MKKNIFIISLLLANFIIPAQINYAYDELDDQVRLYMGQTKFIPVTNLSRVVIGNPAIIDVSNVTKNEVTITPKAPGTTTFAYTDSFGEKSCQVMVFAEDTSEIKRRIDNALTALNLPNVTTRADDEEDRVILLGKVRNAAEREKIYTILGPLKAKITDMIEVKEEAETVEIDVQVLELDKGSSQDLGFSWPGSMNVLEVGTPGISPAGTAWGKLFRLNNVERATTGGADPFTLKLDFLIQEGRARVLSRPRLTCQSGKEAKLLVGGEVPTFTATVSSTGVTTGTVDYKEYGIIMKMRPVVDEGDKIKLNLNIEVSELGTVESTSYAKAYPLIKRTTSTEVFVTNGETLGIGGLIKQKTEEDLRKFPWLGDVPVLGIFFRKSAKKSGGGSTSRNDTELFITITPKLIPQKGQIKDDGKTTLKLKSVSPVVMGDVEAAVADYAQIIQRRVMENLSYPKSAKEAGFQGTTKLGLHLSFRGDLLAATIKSTSGYSVLDDNAIATAKAISMYPPFPSSIKQEDLWLDIPIRYKLD